MPAPQLIAPPNFKYDLTEWPIFLTLREAIPTDEAYARHLENMSSLLRRGEVHVHVVDSSGATSSRREHAKMLAAWSDKNRRELGLYCLGIGMVVQNAVARFGIATMLTLMRKPVPYAAFGTREEAMAWARNIAAQGARRTA